MSSKFRHFDLRLVKPDFAADVTDSIISLETLRKKRLFGSSSPRLFFQLKEIFHLLESIGSARIEGNNTTIAHYIETKITPLEEPEEAIQEIENMEKAMDFVEGAIKHDDTISRAFVSELHKLTVEGLTAGGDKTPGVYRKHSVEIAHSNHLPPDAMRVNDYMEELFNFINRKDDSKYDLLKTAITHHRFCWIHPFGDGNGRTVRLMTYAMLITQGFNVGSGRILNPTAVFCNDRDLYYEKLAAADEGTDASIIEWCTYVLQGLNEEISKVDKLLDHEFLSGEVLLPAIKYCLDRNQITRLDADILRVAAAKQVFQSHDLIPLMPGKVPAERSRIIGRLKKSKLIVPETETGRKYSIGFTNSYLIRGIIAALAKLDFIPFPD